jgi:hypothetical protein
VGGTETTLLTVNVQFWILSCISRSYISTFNRHNPFTFPVKELKDASGIYDPVKGALPLAMEVVADMLKIVFVKLSHYLLFGCSKESCFRKEQ